MHCNFMRDSIAKGVSIGLHKTGNGGANVMMKNKLIFWVSLAAAVSVAATGCGRSRGGADVVVKESETELQTQAQAPQGASWTCSCGSVNTGKFCPNCGAPKPAQAANACPNCGFIIPDPSNPPKFCPECGNKL